MKCYFNIPSETESSERPATTADTITFSGNILSNNSYTVPHFLSCIESTTPTDAGIAIILRLTDESCCNSIVLIMMMMMTIDDDDDDEFYLIHDIVCILYYVNFTIFLQFFFILYVLFLNK